MQLLLSFKSEDFYTFQVKARYINPAVVNLELFGTFKHGPESATVDGDTFNWDLNANRQLYSTDWIQSELFVTIHILTNEDQYWSVLYPNLDRWFEAGLRISF